MLEFQLKTTSFRYGIAEGDDPHAVPFGVLTTLENYVWTKTNRVQKRSGTDFQGFAIVGGGVLSTNGVKRMFTRNSDKELCVTDGLTLYSYSQGVSAWTPIAALPEIGLTHTPIVDPILGVQASDTATSGNFVVTAFTNGDPTSATVPGTLFVCITDLSTGALLMPVTQVSAVGIVVNSCRVIVIGTKAILVGGGAGADANIRAWTIDLTTYAVSAATILRNDRATVGQDWDAAPIGGTSLFVLAYKAAANINLYSYDALFAVQNNSAQAAPANIFRCSVHATIGESVYVAYYDAVAQLVRVYTADPTTMVTVTAPFTVENIAGIGAARTLGVTRYDATSAMVAYSIQLTANSLMDSTSRNVTAAGAITAFTKRSTKGCTFTSAPFVVNGRSYAFATVSPSQFASTPSATFVGNSSVLLGLFPGPDDGTAVVDLTHPVVGVADTLLGALTHDGATLPRFSAINTNLVLGTVPFIGTAPNTKSIWRCAVRLLRVMATTEVPADLWRSVSRGQDTFISGSVLSVYDGGDVFDYGFVYAPVLFTQATVGAGGAILAGVYFYATYLEYRAASGMLYRGPTVVGPLLTTGGAVSTNTLTFSNVNVGNKKHLNVERFGTSLPIFRTVANGSIPQRLTEEPSFNLSPVAYQSATQVFADTKADLAIDTALNSLAARPALYTSGGALDDQQPPASITMFSHVDRLFVLAGDKKTWWYSKSFNDDIGVAPGFNVAFRIVMPTEQTAGASMDDKAVFFGPSGVSYMLGIGPAKDGTGSDFVTPTKIQTDVGCINARSVVSMPDGIMFQSLRGIYILTRTLDVVWIGRAVQDTLAAFPNITSAVMVPNRNEIRFTANNLAGTNGVVMVYNYIEKQWSTSKYLDRVLTGAYGCPIADACMWQGSWTFVTPSGIVYRESDLHFLDGSDTYVPGIIETAWNSAAGPIAYQAVSDFWLNGISDSDHDLTIQCGFDSSLAYQQSRTFPAGSEVTAVGDFEEAKISIGTRRKCNAIRFRITDTAPSTAGFVVGTLGKGPTFQVMGYRVGIKQGDKLGAGKKG